MFSTPAALALYHGPALAVTSVLVTKGHCQLTAASDQLEQAHLPYAEEGVTGGLREGKGADAGPSSFLLGLNSAAEEAKNYQVI